MFNIDHLLSRRIRHLPSVLLLRRPVLRIVLRITHRLRTTDTEVCQEIVWISRTALLAASQRKSDAKVGIKKTSLEFRDSFGNFGNEMRTN